MPRGALEGVLDQTHEVDTDILNQEGIGPNGSVLRIDGRICHLCQPVADSLTSCRRARMRVDRNNGSNAKNISNRV